MKLTSKLIGFLNRVFDKNPYSVVALRFDYDGNMNWRVDDEALTMTVSGGTGVSLAIDLGSSSLSELATYIAAQPGYTVSYTNADIGDLDATILLDTESQAGDGVLYAHQSLLWTWFDAVAKELTLVRQSIESMPAEMVISTASTDWLRELGDLYDIDRFTGEADPSYAIRMINEILELKCNNIALEQAIKAQTGIVATVADIDWWYNPGLLTDLGITGLKAGAPPTGGYPYWGAIINDNPVVCTFAVILGVENVGALDALTVAKIKNIVNKYKAAGTHARYFAPVGNFLNTNTLGETTNNAIYLAGPALPTYSEVTL